MSAPHHPPTYPSGDSLDALSGAHDFAINNLRFTQAHSILKHKYVIHSPSGQLIELFRILNPIKDASYKRNRQLSPPDSHCLPGTRQDVLGEIHMWVKNDISALDAPISIASGGPAGGATPPKLICWLYGFVGCGKSAIAQNIAEEYARRNRLAVSFFFFRNAGDRSTIDRFAATLAHQISLNVPGVKAFIERAIIDDPGLVDQTCSLESQLEFLVYQPLLAALEKNGVSNDDPFLMVVDGLDECMDKEGISTFIDHSIEFFSRNPSIPVRLFITSRIEEHIQTHIEESSMIHLIDLVGRSNRADVASFMSAAFAKARKHDRALRVLGEQWPDPHDVELLVDYCDGSFIFASTICRFILGGSGNSDPRSPMERLPLALKINPGLDGVYLEVLSRAQHLPHFHVIVSTLACINTPLSIAAIADLLGLSPYEVVRVLVILQAILQVPGRDDVPVAFFHTSLRDFLVDQARSGNFYSPPSHHSYLMFRCLDLLFGSHPSTNTECSKYAMVYWPQHLETAARLDDTFDLASSTSLPYKPVEKDGSAEPSFELQWEQRRPLKFFMSEGDWAIMKRNMQKADVAIRLKESADDSGQIARYYWHDEADKSQWRLARTDGYGRSCPPIVSVTSSRPCSIQDIVQGFCVLLSAINIESWVLYLAIRRGEDICVNLEFNRTDSPTADERDRKYIPGGSEVEILNDLSVGLHGHIPDVSTDY